MTDTERRFTRGNLAAYSIALLMICAFASAVAIPIAQSALSFKAVEAGKLLRIDAAQGWSTTSKNLYFTAYSRVATGNINDFLNVKLGSTGYVMPRLGWCSDTSTSNLTVTEITVNSVTYQVSGAGTQRIWCPDRGDPTEITGEDTESWDAANQVLTTTTTGADTITLRWYSTSSLGFFESAWIIINFMPFFIILMAIEAIRNPEYRSLLIKLCILAGFLVMMANLIYAWGL